MKKRSSGVVRLALLAALAVAPCGCPAPAKPPTPPVSPAQAIDADPIALFPAGAVALGELDMRAFYASGTVAAQVAAAVQSLSPPGQDLGVSMSQDVDRVAVAVYATVGLDVAAVFSGRFDAGRMQAAVAARAPGRPGTPWTLFPYGGQTLFVSGSFAFCPLTEHTLLAGGQPAVRRLLDRLSQQGGAPRSGRELPDWMVQAVSAPGTAFAVTADIGNIPPAVLQGWPLPAAMNGLARAALISDFNPPGLNVATTLTYADPPRAAAGAVSLRQFAAVVDIAGKLGAGPQLRNLSIVPDGQNVACRFALDEESLKRSLGSLMKLFAPPGARPAG